MSPASPSLTDAEVERGYNNRAAVPDHAAWLTRWAEASAAALATGRVVRDLRYGSGPLETLDLFLPAGPARGTLVFLHGGYWRALDKSDHAFVAPAFTARGIAVAVVNYDLCPRVTIATIVDECRRAVDWIVRDGRVHGAEPSRLVVAGHSAGGHLTAEMFRTDWRARGHLANPVGGGVSISGVHDLRPMTRFSFNTDFGLDDAEAARLSPVLGRPTTTAPLVIAVGGGETSEFLRQADLLWTVWPDNRPAGATGPLIVPGRHHFDVVMELADPASALARASVALF
ncbi:MAG: alpha/beta hydrolase [Burkholderiales bacterium]